MTITRGRSISQHLELPEIREAAFEEATEIEQFEQTLLILRSLLPRLAPKIFRAHVPLAEVEPPEFLKRSHRVLNGQSWPEMAVLCVEMRSLLQNNLSPLLNFVTL